VILAEAKRITEKNFGRHQTKIRFQKRPKELAEDDVLLEPVIDYVIKEFAHDVDIVCVLQPTAPLLRHVYIDEILTTLEDDRTMYSIFTASKFHGFLWENKKNGYARRLYADKRIRRQDMKPRYLENGAFYAFYMDTYRIKKTMLHGTIGMYVLPKTVSFEIDDYEDLDIVEAIMQYNGDKK